jgi:hypothetical protein
MFPELASYVLSAPFYMPRVGFLCALSLSKGTLRRFDRLSAHDIEGHRCRASTGSARVTMSSRRPSQLGRER